MKTVSNVIFALFMLNTTAIGAQEIAVIGNVNIETESLSLETLKKIYLGQFRVLSNGEEIVPIELANTLAAKQKFHQSVTGKTLDQLNAHWSVMIFTGKGHLVEEVSTERQVLHFVSQNENAIGYISAENLDDSVKVLKILP